MWNYREDKSGPGSHVLLCGLSIKNFKFGFSFSCARLSLFLTCIERKIPTYLLTRPVRDKLSVVNTNGSSALILTVNWTSRLSRCGYRCSCCYGGGGMALPKVTTLGVDCPVVLQVPTVISSVCDNAPGNIHRLGRVHGCAVCRGRCVTCWSYGYD